VNIVIKKNAAGNQGLLKKELILKLPVFISDGFREIMDKNCLCGEGAAYIS